MKFKNNKITMDRELLCIFFSIIYKDTVYNSLTRINMQNMFPKTNLY